MTGIPHGYSATAPNRTILKQGQTKEGLAFSTAWSHALDRHHLTLVLFDGCLAVCRLPPNSAVPSWAFGRSPLNSVTRSEKELSVICAETAVPAGVRCERGWRVMKVENPLNFAQTGILVALADPLADAGVSIFTVSTFDSQYLMVKEASIELALKILVNAGHEILAH
jgi:uncharacterized protein